MAQHNTRHRFHLDIRHGRALRFGETADLHLRKFDIFHIERRDFAHRCFNFRCA